ncbi:MAG: hypothetical protein KH375_02070 [Alistipes sp.]|nr:hypothetical protein [Alistipes sp.]
MKKILNILLVVLIAVTVALLVYAIATGGSETAISLNLIWGYVLLVGAALSVVYCAVKGMVKNPAGIKKTIASVAIIVVVVGAAVAYALSNAGLAIPNSAGGVFDDPFELVVTESSIIVTYVAFVATVIAAVFSEIRNAFK